MSKRQRQEIDSYTLEISTTGIYKTKDEKEYNITQEQESAIQNSILYMPDDFSRPLSEAKNNPGSFETQIKVIQSSTLEACRVATIENPNSNIVALNFASAKNPGGGFLKGASAQEESLARASGLYRCLSQDRMSGYYQVNKKDSTCLYTHSMIYNPKVPIFRDDSSELIPPYLCSFIASPCINYSYAFDRTNGDRQLLLNTLEERAVRVLAVAAEHKHDIIILGAWGCGVFGNSSLDVAQLFHKLIIGPNAPFKSTFSQVIFAILDTKTKEEFDVFLYADEQEANELMAGQEQKKGGRKGGSGRGRGGRGRGGRGRENSNKSRTYM